MYTPLHTYSTTHEVTWRIIPLSQWLKTQVSKSPFTAVIPFIDGL